MGNTYLILGASSEVGMAYIEKLKNNTDPKTIIACYRTESDAFKAVCGSFGNKQEQTCGQIGENMQEQNCGKFDENGQDTATGQTGNTKIIKKQVDLANPVSVKAMAEGLVAEGVCPTHILHLAASNYDFMKIKKWDGTKARKDMEVTYFSFAEICSAFLPLMSKAGYGKVVAVLSSVTLGVPPKFMSHYTACKYALLGYLKGAAAEYAGKGININGISPGMMDTKFLSAVDERILEMTKENSHMQRLCEVGETVAAIEFLMSDAASYMNGANLNLSGGEYMP
ncbi:MAG: SDR family oxidoreductase [Lachnospiraceae bacterium]|nr:SDR family oxidoreductase [Lachnospiraceae bacterium]